MKNIHNGFTLVEVLVSLVIIGVVASLTIPVIKKDSIKEENVAGLKKAYSTLSHVTNMIIENEVGSVHYNARTIIFTKII